MKKVTLIYSSWWWNTTLVVTKVAEILEENHISVELINGIVAIPEDLTKNNFTILAAPTYDHGIIHEPFDRFLRAAETLDLSWHIYACIWLWDSKYDQEYTCESATILESFIKEHWWICLWNNLTSNKSPVHQLDTHVTQRAHTLLTKLATHE